MPWNVSGYPVLAQPKPRRSTKAEAVDINQIQPLSAPNSAAIEIADNRVPIIAARDEDNQLERRSATPEELTEIKANKRGRKKKTVIEKIKTTFIPEE